MEGARQATYVPGPLFDYARLGPLRVRPAVLHAYAGGEDAGGGGAVAAGSALRKLARTVFTVRCVPLGAALCPLSSAVAQPAHVSSVSALCRDPCTGVGHS
jgi:hypothetical protein